MTSDHRPIVLITGATGNLGTSLRQALERDYRIVGLDRAAGEAGCPVFAVDFTKPEAVEATMAQFRERFGNRIASVIHLVAFFDFSGEESPLYESVNVEGTRHLLRALRRFEVEQFVYAGTMLVHAPCAPGERIDESQPIDPRWAYPRSKAAAEEAIRDERGDIPTVILRLAGVYDEETMVPTLARQIARIYERDLESHFYSGSTLVGQAMLHRDDMLDAFRRTVARRAELPATVEVLVGEPDAVGYDALQDTVGRLLHGEEDWATLRLPKAVAAAGAWVQDKLEPVIPDAVDQGEAPFVKPFMVRMADDHYALDIRRARELLGWEPRHRLAEVLPRIVATLQRDPAAWYEANGVTAPPWVQRADELGRNAETLRREHEALLQSQHRQNRWAHFANMGLATWLVTQPLLVAVDEPALRASEIGLGLALFITAGWALSWRATWARWASAAIGMAVMAAPFLFSTASAAAYLSDTLVGALVFAFAVCTKPEPGPSAIATLTGSDIPPGWSYNPSSWTQRLPIIALALIGLYVSRYLAAYQLGHIPDVWDPFFIGSPTDPQNGTEEIITSWVSEAFPVSDAALGGYTYLLEIVTGIVGSRMRWRTMPWLVLLFGLMIAPLGITSIAFIIIQPVVIGTWSTIALIGAAAVLIQIPYSLDELLAVLQFVRRRVQAGQNWLRVLLVGGTDDDLLTPEEAEARRKAQAGAPADEFDRRPREVLRDVVAGGVNLPWNLALAAAIGLALLFTRPLLGAEGSAANAHHVLGSLALTVVSIAAAEVARPLRYLLVPLGLALVAVPFVWEADTASTVAGTLAGVALVACSLRRGAVRERYGRWSKLIV